MDVSLLHDLTEELASFLSEATRADLATSIPNSPHNLGELALWLITQNLDIADVVAVADILGERNFDSTIEDRLDLHHGSTGLDVRYRHTAGLMEDAFAAVSDVSEPRRLQVQKVDAESLYEDQIRNVVVHTWDIAQALGLAYEPSAEVIRRVLRTTVSVGAGTLPPEHGMRNESPTATDVFAIVLTLSGRVAQR
ncbi:hypothetical protein ACWIGI_41180 [Nocardia sp. NPDC055321]